MHEERTIYNSLPSRHSQQGGVDREARASYVLITPVRDEEGYIGAMIDSIARQTIPPKRWIIVDDGSQDRTAEIVTEYARRLPFIELITLPVRTQRLAGGESAIPFALQHIDLSQFGYLARFDADLIFPPDYIERILEEFERDPTLGIAGGMLYVQKEKELTLEPNPQYHVRGALKMYCIRCLVDVGGLTTDLGWDTIDEVRAWSKGWTTHSFSALHVIHCRPTGNGSNGRLLFWQRGRVDYLIWSHPLYVLTRGFRIAYLDRSLIKPCYYLAGYIEMFLKREPRTKDRDFIRARRAQQISRLTEFVTYFGRSNTH